MAVTASLPFASGLSAHPPADPDHGHNESTDRTLWARDVDTGLAGDDAGAESARAQLAARTDVPLARPPAAVQQWNRADLQSLPESTPETSMYPPHARLSDGDFVKDAYVAVFAVQPSTRVHVSPTDRPLYVAPDGVVLGTVDYRLAVPPDNTSGDRRVTWRVRDHDVTAVRLLVDGHPEATTDGTGAVELGYSALDDVPGQTHRLTLQAVVSVRLQKHVRTCADAAENDTSQCQAWNSTVETHTEAVRVSDAVSVRAYDPTVRTQTARYPDGDRGLVVRADQPLAGVRTQAGTARGVWRFYAARDPNWDTLVVTDGVDTRTRHSPLHPLQVNAYPSGGHRTSAPSQAMTVEAQYGPETSPPTLPAHVNLHVATEPYRATHGLATRVQSDEALASVTAVGLVAGASVEVTDHRPPVPIERSQLTLTVRAVTDTTVTVAVRLEAASTGAPINTATRPGYVVVDGTRTNTSATGVATLTLSRPGGGMTARYVPGHWTAATPGYVSDTDAVYMRGTDLDGFAFVTELLVVGVTVLGAAYLLDRLTGTRLWPPWRGM